MMQVHPILLKNGILLLRLIDRPKEATETDRQVSQVTAVHQLLLTTLCADEEWKVLWSTWTRNLEKLWFVDGNIRGQVVHNKEVLDSWTFIAVSSTTFNTIQDTKHTGGTCVTVWSGVDIERRVCFLLATS